MKEYTERVDGFQIRDVSYFGKPPADAPICFDVVKWYPEKKPHIGTVVHITEGGEWTTQEEMIAEYCYSVGFLEWNSHEPCFQFRSVGLRWFEEKPSDAVIDMILNFCAEKEKEIEGMEEL